MFAWGLRHVNVYTVAAGGEGRRQGPKRQLTLTRVDVTKVYYKIYDFERFALWAGKIWIPTPLPLSSVSPSFPLSPAKVWRPLGPLECFPGRP